MNLLSSIGNTPLIRLSSIVPKSSAELWIKYEGNIPTGSAEDFGTMLDSLISGVFPIEDSKFMNRSLLRNHTAR